MASASPVLVVQMRESLFGDFATRSRIPFNLVSALGLGNLKTSPSVAGFVFFFSFVLFWEIQFLLFLGGICDRESLRSRIMCKFVEGSLKKS